MSTQPGVDVAELLRQWRADLIQTGVMRPQDLPERRVEQLADAVLRGDPAPARARLGMKVVERFDAAYRYVEEQAKGRPLSHHGTIVELHPLESGTDEPDEVTTPAPQDRPAAKFQGDLRGPWAAYEDDPPPVRNNLSAEVDAETAQLAWRPAGESNTVCLYRVTFNDTFLPFSPESGTQLATRATECQIDMPYLHALRCVQVWAHVGKTEEEARATAPVPIADTVLVAQPTQVVVREDEGDVYCRWRLPQTEGSYRPIVQAHVQRFRTSKDGHRGASGQTIEAELSGFHDSTAEPGRDYLYRIEITAELPDGRQVTSEPVVAEVSVSAVHEAVVDLTCTPMTDDPSGRTFEAQWSEPAVGEVRIYRSPEEPRVGMPTSRCR